MTIPTIFTPEVERQIVSYDYFDISNGIAYDIYYGTIGDDGTYIATTTNTTYSERIHTGVKETITATFVKWVGDLDFDITFNLPRNIKGDVLLNVPIGVHRATAVNPFYYVTGEVLHVTALGAETSMGTGQSATFVVEDIGASPNDIWSDMALLKISVNLKHFKKGEKLRLIWELDTIQEIEMMCFLKKKIFQAIVK